MINSKLTPIRDRFRLPILILVLGLGIPTELVINAQEVPPETSTDDSFEDTYTLDPFVVSSESDQGYLASETVSASRVKMPVSEIPRSILVVTEELIQDLAPNNLNDIVRFVPGVSNNEDNSEAVNIRGVTVGVPLQDGFRYPRSFPSTQANIERTEVLLGPAAVLYGNVFGTGGVVNRITAKPQFKPQTILKLRLTDEAFTENVTLDTTGPFGQSKRFAYRFIVDQQESEFSQDFTYLDRFSILPSVYCVLGEHTTLDIAFEYTNQSVSGSASDRTDYFLNGELIRLPDDANPMGGLDDLSIEKFGGQFALIHHPYTSWTFRFAGMAYWSDNDVVRVPVAPNINPDGHTISRNQRGTIQKNARGVGNFFFNADAAGDYEFDWMDFSTVWGVDFSLDSDGSIQERADTRLPDFDFLDPDYTVPLPESFTQIRDQRVDTYQLAGYITTLFKFFDHKLLVSGGIRFADFEQNTRRAGADIPKVKGSLHTIPRYGVVYKAMSNLSFYYSYSEAYQVVTAVNPDGSLLAPIEGQQNEIGVKGTLLNNRLQYAVAAYQLDQINNPQNDPDNPGYQVSTGAQRSEGYDFSLVARLSDGLQTILGYSHVDTEILDDANPDNIGLARSGAPNSASFWMRYSVQHPKLKGLSFGIGYVWRDKNPVYRAGDPDPLLNIPKYETYDFMASYRLDRAFRIQLNIRNLFDERYYVAGNQNGLRVGQARTFTLSTSYTF